MDKLMFIYASFKHDIKMFLSSFFARECSVRIREGIRRRGLKKNTLRPEADDVRMFMKIPNEI